MKTTSAASTAALSHATGTHHGAAGTGDFALKVTSVPNPPMPGQSVKLTLAVTDKAGKPVKAFDTEMTKKMHLAVFSDSLKEFQHLHPTLHKDGTFTVETKFPTMEHYALVAEFLPKAGAGVEHARFDLRVKGAPTSAAGPASLQADYKAQLKALNQSIGTGGVVSSISPAELRVGRATMFTVKVVEGDGDSKPITPWLGMPGHAFLISSDRASVMHVHGDFVRAGGATSGDGMDHGIGGMRGMHGDGDMAGMTGMGGMHHGSASAAHKNELGFPVKFDKPGLYKVEVQFERGGKLVTTPFVVNVK